MPATISFTPFGANEPIISHTIKPGDRPLSFSDVQGPALYIVTCAPDDSHTKIEKVTKALSTEGEHLRIIFRGVPPESEIVADLKNGDTFEIEVVNTYGHHGTNRIEHQVHH